jgi:hypothetical protein
VYEQVSVAYTPGSIGVGFQTSGLIGDLVHLQDSLHALAPRKRNRPCIGLLVDRIEDTYQNELMLRIAEAARRHDTSTLCFAGSPLEPSLSDVRNRVYELAGPDNVDAIILSAGSLENKIGSARLLA